MFITIQRFSGGGGGGGKVLQLQLSLFPLFAAEEDATEEDDGDEEAVFVLLLFAALSLLGVEAIAGDGFTTGVLELLAESVTNFGYSELLELELFEDMLTVCLFIFV
jgi:hypothetical protein